MANRQTDKVLFFGDAVTDVGTVQLYPLGTRREEEGQVYRYVSRSDATVTIAAGDVMYRDDITLNAANYWRLTGDVSDTDSAFAAGVAQGAIADGGYGWVKTRGYQSNLKKKPGTAAYSWAMGDVLVAAQAATDDGRASRLIIAAATKVSAAELRSSMERPVGFAAAVATKSSTSGKAFIELE